MDDRGGLFAGSGDGRAGNQPADHEDVVPALAGRVLKFSRGRNGEVTPIGIAEAARQHSNDRVRFAVQSEDLTQLIGAATEVTLPESIRCNRDRRASAIFLLGGEGPPQRRHSAQHREGGTESPKHLQPHRLAPAGQGHILAVVSIELRYGMQPGSPITHPCRVASNPVAFLELAERYHGRGILDRQRLEEDRVNHAEDGAGGADPDSQNQHRSDDQSPTTGKTAEGLS